MCARLPLAAPTRRPRSPGPIKASKAPQVKAAREQMRTLRAQVQAELRKPNPDAKAIARLDAQIDAQRAAESTASAAPASCSSSPSSPRAEGRSCSPPTSARGKGHGKRGGHGQRRGHGKGHGPASAN